LDRYALPPELKAKAVELAVLRSATSPSGGPGGSFGRPAASTVVFWPGQPEEEYRQALEEAESLKTNLPTILVGWRRSGGALYRLGRYEEALKALTRARELEQEGQLGRLNMTTAFLAMTYHRLGQTEKAKEALAQLRREVQAQLDTGATVASY